MSVYFVSGMWCGTCAKTVQAGVSKLPGVVSASINFSNKLLTIDFKEGSSEETEGWEQDLCSKVAEMGFAIKRQSAGWVQTFRQDLQSEHRRAVSLTVLVIAGFLAMWSSTLALVIYQGGLSQLESFRLACLSSLLGIPAILMTLPPFLKAGVRALRAGHMLTLDLFIGLGGMSALFASLYNLAHGSDKTYVDSSAMILVILLSAKVLESKLASYLAAQLLSQMEHARESVQVAYRNGWRSLEASAVRRDDRVKVDAEELVLFDGLLLTEARLNSHLFNGEADDLILSAGEMVYAGSIARTSLEMLVQQPLGLRMIDGWAESALLARNRPHAFSVWIERLENNLTGIALLGAAVLAFLQLMQGGGIAAVMQAFAVGVLIFCPCLFNSILPMSKQMAHLALNRRGVILGRAECLFDLSQVEHVYFDKTGTLEAVDSYFVSFSGVDQVVVKQFLQRVARICPHPVLSGLTRERVNSVTEIEVCETPGQGVFARDLLHQESMWVGRPTFVRQALGLAPELDDDYPLVAYQGKIVGKIITQSRFNQVASECLSQLLKLLPETTTFQILSGDPKDGAGQTLCSLSPERISYRGNLRPEQKAELISGKSLFVGDGLNDTLALAQASVSCRLGQRASSATADLRLLDGDLRSLVQCFTYSQRFLRVLLQTGLLAFSYNVVTLTLAATGHFNPLGAVLAMALSLSLLTLSSLRLLWV